MPVSFRRSSISSISRATLASICRALPGSVQEYLAELPEERRKAIAAVRDVILRISTPTTKKA